MESLQLLLKVEKQPKQTITLSVWGPCTKKSTTSENNVGVIQLSVEEGK